jgi:membrane associated rhomboid family serine protease
MMKRVLSILSGAIFGVLAAYLITYGVGWLWGPLYDSEEDMARNVKLFLAGVIVFAFVGGCVANWVFSNRTSRKTSHHN